MASLWPLTTAWLGVYEEPPPVGSGIDYVVIEEPEIDDDFLNRELLKTAKAATRLKDRIHALFG